MTLKYTVYAGLLVALLFEWAVCVTGATILYVAPDGRDEWSGLHANANASRTDGPLASLTCARDAIRRLRAEGRIDGPMQVQIADGQYIMHETLVLTDMDSGTETGPIRQ